jgi:TolB-like protein
MLRLLCAMFVALLIVPAAPARAAERVLVVFPFAVRESIPEIDGAAITDRIAAEITALGGLKVVRGATSAPGDYRAQARAAGADLYFTGIVAAIGNTYSAIEQLVTTRGGTVVWSTTMNFRSVADIRGEGARVHDEVLRGATPPPAPTVTPSGH